ncbi:NAD(P)H-binding protein [Salinifilum ghardaiensis]
MRVAIAGAHGQIARHLTRELVRRGDEVTGFVRNPDHVADVIEDGALPRVVDVENADARTVAGELSGVDAAVFAAGAGPGSGAARKDTVDRAGSVLLAEACETAGVARFVQISAMGTTRPNPPDVGEVFGAYLDAKREAEADLRSRQLDWTILRPGRLTDGEPTGLVELAASVARDDVTRADVAATAVAVLDERRSVRKALEVVNGATPIVEALRTAVAR